MLFEAYVYLLPVVTAVFTIIQPFLIAACRLPFHAFLTPLPLRIWSSPFPHLLCCSVEEGVSQARRVVLVKQGGGE